MTITATRPDALTAYVPRLLLDAPLESATGHWSVDGTLVFADISGFTRLTERLSRQGKAGAEELVTTLSGIFTELLQASEGGDVLKFGGDALLILYTGPEHERRACVAAQNMQRTLRRIGSIESSQGRVRLRMSVGVHSDSLTFFLVGNERARELFVLGPAATRLVEIEGAAEAGEILVSSRTAATLLPAWLGGTRGEASLVRRIPTHLPWDPPPPIDGAEERAELFIPMLLRGRLGEAMHEHRRVTTSFVHVGGVDDLLLHRGPDAVLDRVDQLTRTVMDVCDELGILLVTTDVGADGGKFMLTAGAPDASEDDEGRMLRAAHRIVTADVGLPVRAGVNHGHVFAGDVGAPFRRTYSTMGDPVNLAARLMGKAPVGRVLAARSVIDRAAGRFQAEPVPAFTVKGKTHPIDAVLVGAAVDDSEVAGDLALPLVGRDEELAALEGILHDALTGTGRIVEIDGELGTGKSRLVAELAERNPDVAWNVAKGDPYAARTPYHVARSLLRRLLRIPSESTPQAAGELLRSYLEAHAPHLVSWAPLIAIPVGAEVAPTPEVDRTEPRFRRTRMHAVVSELLGVSIGPGVVVVDGTEHVDEASADLLGDVLRDVLPDRAWLVVLCRRSGTEDTGLPSPSDAISVHLGPLAPAAEATLLRHACVRFPLPDHAATVVRARSGGNPLFLLELVRAAAGAGSVDALPGSIESILATRLDALPDTDRRALRELAVLGEDATHPAVDHVLAEIGVSAGDREFWSRLAEHVDWSPTDIRFRHSLVRQVAYEGLTYRRRRELHGRAADILLESAGDRSDWSLSWHLTQAERWPEAWVTAVEAGDQACATYANAEAAAFYRRALDAAAHLPDLPDDEHAAVAERWGDACELAGLYADAAEAFTEARRRTPDPVTELRLIRKRGVIDERLGHYSSALRWYGRGLSAVREDADDALTSASAQLQAAYAGVLYRQGRLRPSTRRAQAAAELAARAGDRPTLAHAYYLLDAALTDLGADDEAARYRHQALPIFEELGDLIGQANVTNNFGVDAFFAGRLDESLAFYRRSREARATAGDVVGAATADNNIGELLVERGDHDQAEPLFEDALRIWRGARYALGVAVATSNLGVVAASRGEHRTASERFRAALDGFIELGANAFVAEAALRLARALAELGRWVEVWEVAGLAEGDDPQVSDAARQLKIRALEATGSTERAAQLAAGSSTD